MGPLYRRRSRNALSNVAHLCLEVKDVERSQLGTHPLYNWAVCWRFMTQAGAQLGKSRGLLTSANSHGGGQSLADSVFDAVP
jgi:hypothetical protein